MRTLNAEEKEELRQEKWAERNAQDEVHELNQIKEWNNQKQQGCFWKATNFILGAIFRAIGLM